MKYKESNNVELKELLTVDNNFEKEVVAFLNYSQNGVIYIGVNDDGTSVGLDNPNSIQLQIKDRIKNNIAPSTIGLFDVVLVNIEGKSVIKVLISPGNKKPYYIRKYGRSPEGCFIRLGNSKQKMTEELINKMQEDSLPQTGKATKLMQMQV